MQNDSVALVYGHPDGSMNPREASTRSPPSSANSITENGLPTCHASLLVTLDTWHFKNVWGKGLLLI